MPARISSSGERSTDTVYRKADLLYGAFSTHTWQHQTLLPSWYWNRSIYLRSPNKRIGYNERNRTKHHKDVGNQRVPLALRI